MPKEQVNRRQETMNNWIRGPGRTVRGRGKDTGMESTVYQKNYAPQVAQKSEAPEAPKFVAGANTVGQQDRPDFDSTIKTRADDPRNWEFHYKAPDPNRHFGPTKGMSGDERRTQAFRNARMGAEKTAKLTGEAVYDTMKIEYDTEGLMEESRRTRAVSKASGRFGSTKVAQNVEAQRQMTKRKTGRGQSRTTDPFEAKTPTRSQRIA